MTDQSTDEFYVGYQPAAPPGLGRVLRRRVPLLLGLALGAVLALAWTQERPAPVRFEYGTILPVTGQVRERPYPMLFTADSSGRRTWLLAAPYKRGADGLVAGLDDQTVEARVTRIYRPGAGMLEVHHLTRAGGAGAPPIEERDLGLATLTGEVVDGKCWIGAMNPGDGPTHRLCAARCLRGDLPPMLAGRDSTGAPVAALLTGPGGRRLETLLSFVAARVRVTGRLRQVGTLLVLETDPASIERVTP